MGWMVRECKGEIAVLSSVEDPPNHFPQPRRFAPMEERETAEMTYRRRAIILTCANASPSPDWRVYMVGYGCVPVHSAEVVERAA
jgi:hypothetical protein